MPRYEVFVPAAPPVLPGDATLHVEGDHWLGALREGLTRIGGGRPPANVLCDVQADGSIHVTDCASGRVFRIREVVAAPSAPGPAGPIGRPAAALRTEDVLAEVYARASAAKGRGRREGLAFLLDLALEHAACEAGTLFLLTAGGDQLAFEVVRGPRAAEIARLGITVPVGVGIAGFCAREGVCVAVSEAARDPRHAREVAKAIQYEARSLLCAPIARPGRVLGVLEVLNKRGGAPFRPTDVAVVSYLAHQAAALLERAA
ncbi:MAG TPA: GAF domain-containing protein [Anaeromyxobacteraceae bacterium]|nr:GAF domain-containing protein [Anaeromyxobacteraceae bacterium]